MPAYRDGERWKYRKRIGLPDGSRVRVKGTPPQNSRRAAERCEREHIERRLKQFYDAKNGVTPKEVPTVEEFLPEFFANYVDTHNKPSEQKAKRQICNQWIGPFFGKMKLDGIATRDVEKFKTFVFNAPAHKGRGHRSNKRVKNVLGVLSKLLRFAHECEIIDRLPRIKMPKTAPAKFRFLSREELAHLVEAASESRWLVAILLGADAGLRHGEILGLRWSDWDRASETITVHRNIVEGHEQSTKGWNIRVVRLTKRLTAALTWWRKTIMRDGRLTGGFYILSGLDERSVTHETTRWAMRRLCKEAKISPAIGWHPLRHTFCTNLAMSGVPGRVIQQLAGHADLQTTQKYMHYAEGATADGIAKLERYVHAPAGSEVGPSDVLMMKSPTKHST